MLCVNLAVEPVQAVIDHRVAERGELPVDALPFVCAAHGELVGDMALLAGEDIDGEALCLANLRVAEGACLDAEGDQRRIHRDAVERLAGEADRFVVDLGGDDRDAGGEVAEGFTETGGVDSGVSLSVGIGE